MPKIFISYRRADSRAITGRIYDRLADAFGADNVFKDVDDIPPGTDFRSVLQEATRTCDVMLVIVGKQWVNITDAQGKRRLDDPGDFVRLEVETGLQSERILVIPLLVEGAVPPQVVDLPSSLQQLAFHNALEIRDDPDFHRDMDRLIHHLGGGRRRWRRWVVPGMIAALIALIAAAILLFVKPESTPDTDKIIGKASVYLSHPDTVAQYEQVEVELILYFDTLYITPTPSGGKTEIPVTQAATRPPVVPVGPTATPYSARFSEPNVEVPEYVIAALNCNPLGFTGCGEQSVRRLRVDQANSWAWQLTANGDTLGIQRLRLELWTINADNMPDQQLWWYDFSIEIVAPEFVMPTESPTQPVVTALPSATMPPPTQPPIQPSATQPPIQPSPGVVSPTPSPTLLPEIISPPRQQTRQAEASGTAQAAEAMAMAATITATETPTPALTAPVNLTVTPTSAQRDRTDTPIPFSTASMLTQSPASPSFSTTDLLNMMDGLCGFWAAFLAVFVSIGAMMIAYMRD